MVAVERQNNMVRTYLGGRIKRNDWLDVGDIRERDFRDETQISNLQNWVNDDSSHWFRELL